MFDNTFDYHFENQGLNIDSRIPTFENRCLKNVYREKFNAFEALTIL